MSRSTAHRVAAVVQPPTPLLSQLEASSSSTGSEGPLNGQGKRSKNVEAILYKLLQQLSPKERKCMVQEHFTEAQRLALERWILGQDEGPKRKRSPSLEVRRKWSEGGVHCRFHAGRSLWRAHATVGPFSVASRYDAARATAERFREVLCAMSKRVALASSIDEVEEFFRAALLEEPRKWGLNGREDMRLCFTAFVSAKHWIGRSLTTPRFGVTEVEEGLRAWHKLRQALKPSKAPKAPVLAARGPRRQEVWSSLRKAYLEIWASCGRQGAAAKLQALRLQHERSNGRRDKEFCSLMAPAILVVILTSRACFWDFRREIPFAYGVLCDSFRKADDQDARHRRQIFQKRRKNVKAVATLWGLSGDVFLCTLLVISTESQLTTPHFWACVLGSIVLRKCGDPAVELESHHVTIAFVMMNIATVLAGASLPPQLHPLISVSRLLLGLFFAVNPLDALLTNLALSVGYIYVTLKQHGSDFSPRSIGLSVFGEVFMILNLSLVLFFVDSILKTMQITTMKMEAKSKEAEANMDAARKLLNVTCDASVHLTSDFKIKDPEKAFIELIAGSTEAQEVEKWSILDFISPPDRKRFCELANTQVDSAQSLSLQLLDTLGTAIEARFYYVQVPTFEVNDSGELRPQHLVGISEVISGQVGDDKSSRTAQSKPEEDMRFLLGAGMRNEAMNVRSGHASPQEVAERRSAVSQGTTGTTTQTVEIQTEAWTKMNGIDNIRLIVDATGITEGFCIHSAEFNFDHGVGAEMLPNLMEWVMPDSRPQIFCWLQDHVNAFISGQTCDRILEGLEMVDPVGQCLSAGRISALRLDRSLDGGDDLWSSTSNVEMAVQKINSDMTDVSCDGRSLSKGTSVEEFQEFQEESENHPIIMEICIRDLYRLD